MESGAMDHPLQCKCGKFKGVVRASGICTRIACYCKDCQAYARYLGNAEAVLDAMGGTDIVVAHPRSITFTEGLEALACMSLAGDGMLRWYAACCNTPIGNTPADMKVAYVGLVHSCMANSSQSLEHAFGPVRMRAGTGSAKGTVKSTPLGNIASILRFAAMLIGARLNGSYKRTPFFDANGTPLVPRKVLGSEERARVMGAA